MVMGESLSLRGAEDSRFIKAEKLRRLREEALRTYAPSEPQLAFHKSRALIRGLFGGNQSGKSWAKNIEMLYTVLKVHPWRKNYTGPVFGRDCYQSEDVIEKVAIPTYKRMIPRGEGVLGWKTYEGLPAFCCGLRGGDWESAYDRQFQVLNFADGSFIEFKTYAQAERNLQSFAGPPRHIISHDEEPTEEVYNENMARQVTLGVNMLFAMTPLNYSQWLYSDIYDKAAGSDRIDVFKMSSFDNPTADKEALRAIEESIVDPAIRAARLYGEFTYLEGLVYKEYGDHNLFIPFTMPKHWERTVVIDPHPAKPTAVNWFAEDNEGRTWCYREADLTGSVEHIASQISTMTGNENISHWLVDPASRGQKTDWGRKDDIYEEFLKYFPYLQLANNNRLEGWDRVRSACRRPHPNAIPMLVVSRDCPLTHHQMKNYSWKEPTKSGEDRRKPDVVKKNDDHPDNIRYKLMHKNNYDTNKFTGFGVTVYGN